MKPSKSISTKIVSGGRTVSNSVGKNYPSKMARKGGGTGNTSDPRMH